MGQQPPLPPPPPPYQPQGGSQAPPPAFPPAPPGYSGYPAAAGPSTDGMAIASLILGIIAFPGLCCYGVPGIAFGVVALILGRISVGKIKRSNGTIGGYGLAQAGWICGLVAMILGVIIGLFYLVFIVLGVTGAFNNISIPSPSP